MESSFTDTNKTSEVLCSESSATNELMMKESGQHSLDNVFESGTCMEEITFTKDRILSDVHIHVHLENNLIVRLDTSGEPVFQSHFQILWRNEDLELKFNKIQTQEEVVAFENPSSNYNFINSFCSHALQEIKVPIDDDGDLEVMRRPNAGHQNCSREVLFPTILTLQNGEQDEYGEALYRKNIVVKIEHSMATMLEDVGKQIWCGALFLADYILWKHDHFRGCTVLELGAGTGFTSIIMATVAKRVFCTDVGEELLKMCENNVTLNKDLTGPSGGKVNVKVLDWRKNEFCSDPADPYCWTEEEISTLYDETTFIVAADVFYDNDLTDALFETVQRISHRLRHPCCTYFSVEKRFNFTLRYMDITSDAYNHFQYCLNKAENIRDGKRKWIIEEIKPTFPQYFIYERSDHLVLWKMIAVPNHIEDICQSRL